MKEGLFDSHSASSLSVSFENDLQGDSLSGAFCDTLLWANNSYHKAVFQADKGAIYASSGIILSEC